MPRAIQMVLVTTVAALAAALTLVAPPQGAHGSTADPAPAINATRATRDALAAALRPKLHQDGAATVFTRLGRSLLPAGATAPFDATAVVQEHALGAALLARAAQARGREDVALPLFEALHARHAEAGDHAVAARLAIRAGDVLTAAGHDVEADTWYQRAAGEDVALRALLGRARALRRAGKAAEGLALLEGISPLQLDRGHNLRARLIAEAARCAAAAKAADKRQTYVVTLWSEHPGYGLAYPGGGDKRDPDPFAGLSKAWLRTKAGESGLVNRAEALLRGNANQPALTLARSIGGDDAERHCRALYVQGKALRNLRRYSTAVPILEQTVKDCAEQAPKALYLLGKVLAFRGHADKAMAAFDRFVAAYPKHDFADDMLFFAGDQLTQRGRHEEAERYYRRIADDYPEGDYRDEALWRAAWGAHLAADDARARELLDVVARAKAGQPDPRPYQQAIYWRARLSLGEGKEQREAALDDLDALVRADPIGLYGIEARALVQRLAPDRARATDEWLLERTASFAAAEGTPPPTPSLPAARLGHALVAAGLDEEARAVLNTIDFTALDLGAAVAIARDLAICGDTHNAHWVVRKRAEQELHGLPDPADAMLWRAGFPLGFSELVEPWAQQRSLDSKLVYALIREESAFDAPVVSWAGAIGLMQIMPSTAKEEAGLDKLEGFKVSQLRDPDVNIRLGTAHIARRLRHFKGNTPLAVASYNAGPANVQRWLRATPGSELDVYMEAIPIEQTRHYTKRVLRTWAVYRFLYNPEQPFIELPEKVK